MDKSVRIIFNYPAKGAISVTNGSFASLTATGGTASGNSFSPGDGVLGLKVDVSGASLSLGAHSTVVHVECEKPFSFFLRDVHRENPIYIPEYGAIVTEACDGRDYTELERAVESRGRLNRIDEITGQDEETFADAASRTRKLQCPTWLGISRDMRIFEVRIKEPARGWFDWIKPQRHGTDVVIQELAEAPVYYVMMCGRGIGVQHNVNRRLEEGALPILNVTTIDDEVEYDRKFFVSTERSPLREDTLRGTDATVADTFGWGNMLTPEQREKVDNIKDTEINREEETVIYIKVDAVNRGRAPRYAFVYIGTASLPYADLEGQKKVNYDANLGMGLLPSGKVLYLVAARNGKPVPQREFSVLLQPGEKMSFVYKIPHSPISRERAEALNKVDFDEKLAECIAFWKGKLAAAARISVPEKTIDEHIKAGHLHIDLAYYGREPQGPVLPVVGGYTAIGSESSPGIQYLDSIGQNKLAERAIRFFIAKQHDDGFMQNFGGYMLETGSVLWTIGEHYRYTRDTAFIKEIKDSLLKACGYLIQWRRRNQDEKFRGQGYGMLDGKVADPEDPFHSYMLNAGAYSGLLGAAAALESVDAKASAELKAEAEALKNDIRTAYLNSLAKAPVMPLLDGTWVPAAAPWAEASGPLCLYVDGGDWYTHGSFLSRDTLCGNSYLFLQGVFHPKELYTDFFVKVSADSFFQDNTAFSQPYYSTHPYANAVRGEVKPFLKEFYSNLSALSDRETYSFWEHLFRASPHKLHEEGWFLMRCRWMLYIEDGDTLKIMPMVPRAWLEEGKGVTVTGVKSYFGELGFSALPMADGNYRCSFSLKRNGHPKPGRIEFRIPHPKGIAASGSSAGTYCPAAESVIFEPGLEKAEFELVF
jgi:hypothetical protein